MLLLGQFFLPRTTHGHTLLVLGRYQILLSHYQGWPPGHFLTYKRLIDFSTVQFQNLQFSRMRFKHSLSPQDWPLFNPLQKIFSDRSDPLSLCPHITLFFYDCHNLYISQKPRKLAITEILSMDDVMEFEEHYINSSLSSKGKINFANLWHTRGAS